MPGAPFFSSSQIATSQSVITATGRLLDRRVHGC